MNEMHLARSLLPRCDYAVSVILIRTLTSMSKLAMGCPTDVTHLPNSKRQTPSKYPGTSAWPAAGNVSG